jgi:hypothetical protein
MMLKVTLIIMSIMKDMTDVWMSGFKEKGGFLYGTVVCIICLTMQEKGNIKLKYYKFSRDTLLTLCRVMMTQLSDKGWKEGEQHRAMNLLLDQADRKITRNQKRKHCEIHHLQKASILPNSNIGKRHLSSI